MAKYDADGNLIEEEPLVPTATPELNPPAVGPGSSDTFRRHINAGGDPATFGDKPDRKPTEPEFDDRGYKTGSYASRNPIGRTDAERLDRSIDRTMRSGLSTEREKQDAGLKRGLLDYYEENINRINPVTNQPMISPEEGRQILEEAMATNNLGRNGGRRVREALGVPTHRPGIMTRNGLRKGAPLGEFGVEDIQQVSQTRWLEALKAGATAKRATDALEAPGEDKDIDPYVKWGADVGVDYAAGDKVAQSVINERRKKIFNDQADRKGKALVERAAAQTPEKQNKAIEDLTETLIGMNDPKDEKPGWDWGVNKSTWEKQLADNLAAVKASGATIPPELASQIPGQETQRTERDNQAVAWAQANPNDPRAAKILQLNGM